MRRWRFVVTPGANPSREVFPVGIFQSKFRWQRERGQVFFRKTFPDALTFNDDNGDFAYFLNLEQNGSQCTPIRLDILEVCQGDTKLRWTGYFTTGKGKFDLDACLFEVSAEVYDDFNCILEKLDDEYNLLAFGGTPVVVRSVIGEIHELVKMTVTIDCEGAPIEVIETCKLDGVFVPCGGINFSEWCLFSTIVQRTACPGGDTVTVTRRYKREEITTACVGGLCQPPDPSWTLLSSDCGGSGNCTFYRCNFAEVEYDRGVLLNNVITSLLSLTNCGLSYSSIFFNNNPDILDPIYALTAGGTLNYVTGNSTWTANLVISQKSDVIDPNSSNSATMAMGSLSMILTWLEYMFNVRWTVVDGVFKIEHISYFESQLNTSLNLLSGDNLDSQKGKNKYEHTSDEIPRRVWFRMMEGEPDGIGDFKDSAITYDEFCATAEDEERDCENLTTNLEYIIQWPADISKDGFVMIATKEDGGIYYINIETGVVSNAIHMNAHLSWANLLDNYHRHAAYLQSGNLNGTNVTFISFSPNVKQPPIEINYCCSDAFVAYEKYSTLLGSKVGSYAFVDSAELTLGNDILKINFKYNV